MRAGSALPRGQQRARVAALDAGRAEQPADDVRRHPYALVHAWRLADDGALVLDFETGDQTETSGSRTLTVVPQFGADSISTLPPSSAVRSRIEVSPTPAWRSAGRPTPSSRITRCSSPSIVITTEAVRASACRARFVSASCVIRKTATSTAAGSGGSGSGASTSQATCRAPPVKSVD